MNSDAIFAIVVGVLAALAVIGALVFAIVWEVYAPPHDRSDRLVLAQPDRVTVPWRVTMSANRRASTSAPRGGAL
jgi:hypothetical protein